MGGSVRIMFLFCLALSARADQTTFTLNDGNSMRALALGTSLGHLADGTRVVSKDKLLSRAVQSAIQSGYRHIDTASLYLTESEVGEGTVSKINDTTVRREEMFITTKLWNDAHERPAVLEALRQSLHRLQLEYVDLYLMHYPMAYTKSGEVSATDYLETWRGLEDARALHLTRSIGVSNFNLTQMERLYRHATVKPAVLQIEVNPTITQRDLVEWCVDHNVTVQPYSPFGAIFGRKPDAPPPRHNDAVFVELGRKYNKTTAQILLRYLLDRNIAPIARSMNADRIAENFHIFDFKLEKDDIGKLSSYNKNFRLRTPAKWYDHPQFPFERKHLSEEEKRKIIENSKED